MPVKLYLVQHGEACASEVDPERPLTERGRADVELLAAFLSQAGLRVGCVVHSGKLRARQTADILAAAVAPGVVPVSRADINPNDDPTAIDWGGAEWGRDTLVVSHMPFLAGLVSFLVTGVPDKSVVAYLPGTLVCLERAEGGWQIDWVIRPELLRGLS